MSAPGQNAGPISTFPAAWTDVCGFPVHGNTTTSNDIESSFLPGVAKFSLDQVYSSIVASPSFKQAAAGRGWVTAQWDLFQVSGPNGTSHEVEGLFVLTSAGGPAGFVRAYYDLETGAVTADYESGLFSSCPARAESSYGGSLDRPSPAYYPTGMPITITFSVTDYTVANLSVSSSTSCISGLVVRAGDTEGAVIYNSTRHPGCSGPPLHLVLNPGQNYTQTLSWDQTDDLGNQVPYGAYEIMGNSPQNSSMSFNDPIGRVYFGTPVPISQRDFLSEFYFNLDTPQSFYSPGQTVKINEGFTNNGPAIADIETTTCSFSYKILNLTGALVYDSTKHQVCTASLTDNPIPPMGGIGQTAYWNLTDDSGSAAGPGLYHIVEDIRVMSGGQELNSTQRWDMLIGSSSPSPDMIGIRSSSICGTPCGGPSLSAVVDANGNLKSLTLYLNGVGMGTRTYSSPCSQMTCEFTFSTPIDNQSVPIFPGGSYEIVFVGTFQDGNTSISWANPLLPWH